MSRKADRKGRERKGRSPGQVVSAPGQVTPGREWKGLGMGALALSGLQWPRRDETPPPGNFSGLGPASAGEEEEVHHSGWSEGGLGALCTAGEQLLTCHGPGALVLSPWAPLRLSTDNWALLVVGRHVCGKPEWSPGQSEDSSAARPAGAPERATCLWRNSAGPGRAQSSICLLIYLSSPR